jgi:hypothetical protein
VPESVELFRFASRFIQLANGRRRPLRSITRFVSAGYSVDGGVVMQYHAPGQDRLLWPFGRRNGGF